MTAVRHPGLENPWLAFPETSGGDTAPSLPPVRPPGAGLEPDAAPRATYASVLPPSPSVGSFDSGLLACLSFVFGRPRVAKGLTRSQTRDLRLLRHQRHRHTHALAAALRTCCVRKLLLASLSLLHNSDMLLQLGRQKLDPLWTGFSSPGSQKP